MHNGVFNLRLILIFFVAVVLICPSLGNSLHAQFAPTQRQEGGAPPELQVPDEMLTKSPLLPLVAFPSPVQGNPRGLAYDGTFLYITNFGQPNAIYKVNPVTGQLVQTITHNLGELGCLAYDCSDGSFWAGDYNTGNNRTVYHFNAGWQLISYFYTPEVEIIYGGLDGLTVVNNYNLLRGA